MFSALLLLALQMPAVEVKPAAETEKVSQDPDDPAIWVNRKRPQESLILGTNKAAAPDGALYVFGLDGKVRQRIGPLNRPNNVDVEYGFRMGKRTVDLAVVTERLSNRLVIYSIGKDGVREAGAITCCNAPMGIGLYRRPSDGRIFAIVAPKSGPPDGYLYQYRLDSDAEGKIKGTLVRRFGQFSMTKEIEAVVVDDELGFVYYSDEGAGIRKYHADPDHPDAQKELGHFAREGFRGDREGLAIVAQPKGAGYLIATDQIPGSSEYHVFGRDGNNAPLFVFRGGADSTDGIEAVTAKLGPGFPEGLMVAMNSSGKNFLLFRLNEILRAAGR
jgi:3-phytase